MATHCSQMSDVASTWSVRTSKWLHVLVLIPLVPLVNVLRILS
jgi:hypothetical protein